MAEPIPPAMRMDDGPDGVRRSTGDPGQAGPLVVAPSAAGSPVLRSSGGQPDQSPAAGAAGARPASNTFSERPLSERTAQDRQAYAAIDLGTNNCRLLIARPAGENFAVIDAFSRVVRLGEGLAQTGRLGDAAMDRAVAALGVCADKLKRRNIHLARSVATEACRRAANGAEFIDRVRRETGIALNVISAQEEARLAVLGCHILLEQGEGPAMIFDIGGGSTELILVENGPGVPRILDWQSVPWGVVSLTETCGEEPPTSSGRAARYTRMHALVRDAFAPFAERVGPAREQGAGRALRLLGTSGTVTTLASLHLDLPQYDRNVVDGVIVPADAMRGISQRLSGLSLAERRQLPCIGRERADLVVAGCAILDAILDLWPASRLGVADRGIREGILRSLMASSGRPLQPDLNSQPGHKPLPDSAPQPARQQPRPTRRAAQRGRRS